MMTIWGRMMQHDACMIMLLSMRQNAWWTKLVQEVLTRPACSRRHKQEKSGSTFFTRHASTSVPGQKLLNHFFLARVILIWIIIIALCRYYHYAWSSRHHIPNKNGRDCQAIDCQVSVAHNNHKTEATCSLIWALSAYDCHYYYALLSWSWLLCQYVLLWSCLWTHAIV